MQSKNLTIVYIITKLELGGAQKVCLTLFNNICDSQIKTILISGNSGELVEQIKDRANIILLDSFKWEISSVFCELKNFFNLIKVLRKIKKENQNLIVHTHSTKAGLLGRWAAFFVGIKLRLHTVHCWGFHKGQNKIFWLVNYFLEFFTSFITTKYICVSSYDVTLGKKLIFGFKKKYTIIRAAIDFDKFIAAKKIENFENKQFVFGTTFKKQKSMLDLMHAFNYVQKICPNIKLELLGNSIIKKDLEDFVKKNNLDNCVTFLGWQKEAQDFMKNWDSFVLTSTWEGLPCAIIEARLLKLPIISYDTGGISDIIEHNKNGLLYKIGDWQNLALGMLKIVQDKTFYNNLKNYQDNLSNFDNKNMIENHKIIYKNYF